jgi:hypothetical protein
MDQLTYSLEVLLRRAEATISIERLSREQRGGSGIQAHYFLEALHAEGASLDLAISMLATPSGHTESSIGVAIGCARRAVMLGEDEQPFLREAKRHLDYFDRS